jgi:hypothetical protein
MANLNDRIRRLVLTKDELRQLVPNWSNALIEDYLGISEDIAAITSVVINDETDLAELEKRVDATEQSIIQLWLAVDNLQNQINELKDNDLSNDLIPLINPPNTANKKISMLEKVMIALTPRPVKKLAPAKIFEGFITLFNQLIQNRNRWQGVWNVSTTYLKNDEVLDSGFLMIANKKTRAKPAPILLGDPAYYFGTARLVTQDGNWLVCVNGDVLNVGANVDFVTQSYTGAVQSGQIYTFKRGVMITEVAVQVASLDPSYEYSIVYVDITDPNNPITTIYSPVITIADEFQIVAYIKQFAKLNDKILIYVNAVNRASTTVFSSTWNYAGTSNLGDPNAQEWNNRTQQDIVRVHITDNLGADQEGKLLQVVSGTILTATNVDNELENWTYYIESVINNSPVFEFDVILTGTGSAGGVPPSANTVLRFDIPIATPTLYREDPVFDWSLQEPSNATVQGFLALDGVNQNQDTRAYGIDIRTQNTDFSSDWDIKSVTGELTTSSNIALNGDDVITINDNDLANPEYISDVIQPTSGLGYINREQITFGAAKGNIDALGTWTAPEDGQFTFLLKANAQRNTSAQEVFLWVFIEINGVVSDVVELVVIDGIRQRERLQVSINATVEREDTFKAFMYLDDTSFNDGQLSPFANTDGLPDAPSAALTVTKLIIDKG